MMREWMKTTLAGLAVTGAFVGMHLTGATLKGTALGAVCGLIAFGLVWMVWCTAIAMKERFETWSRVFGAGIYGLVLLDAVATAALAYGTIPSHCLSAVGLTATLLAFCGLMIALGEAVEGFTLEPPELPTRRAWWLIVAGLSFMGTFAGLVCPRDGLGRGLFLGITNGLHVVAIYGGWRCMWYRLPVAKPSPPEPQGATYRESNAGT